MIGALLMLPVVLANATTSVFLFINKSYGHNDYLSQHVNVGLDAGLLTSTARTFILNGITTKHATQVIGTRIKKGLLYPQYFKKSSRALNENPQQTLFQTNIFSDNSNIKKLQLTKKKETSSNNNNSNLHSKSEGFLLQFTTSAREQIEGSERDIVLSNIVTIGNLPTYTVRKNFSPNSISANTYIQIISQTSGAEENNRYQGMFKNGSHKEQFFNRSHKFYYKLMGVYGHNASSSKNKLAAPSESTFNGKPLTTTYFRFTDFKTVVGNSVIVFSPNCQKEVLNLEHVTPIKGEGHLSGLVIEDSISGYSSRSNVMDDTTKNITPVKTNFHKLLNSDVYKQSQIAQQIAVTDLYFASTQLNLSKAVESGVNEDLKIADDKKTNLVTSNIKTATQSNNIIINFKKSSPISSINTLAISSRPSNQEVYETYLSLSHAEAERKLSTITPSKLLKPVKHEFSVLTDNNYLRFEDLENRAPGKTIHSDEVGTIYNPTIQILGGTTIIFFEDEPHLNYAPAYSFLDNKELAYALENQMKSAIYDVGYAKFLIVNENCKAEDIYIDWNMTYDFFKDIDSTDYIMKFRNCLKDIDTNEFLIEGYTILEDVFNQGENTENTVIYAHMEYEVIFYLSSSHSDDDLTYKSYLTQFFAKDCSSISNHTEGLTNIIKFTLKASSLDIEPTTVTDQDLPLNSMIFKEALESNESRKELFGNTQAESILSSDKCSKTKNTEWILSDKLKTTNLYLDDKKVFKTYFTSYTYYTTFFVKDISKILSSKEMHTSYLTEDIKPTTEVLENKTKIVSSKKWYTNYLMEGISPTAVLKKNGPTRQINESKLPSITDVVTILQKEEEYIAISSRNQIPNTFYGRKDLLGYTKRMRSFTDLKNNTNIALVSHNKTLHHQFNLVSNVDEIKLFPPLLSQAIFTTITYLTTMYSDYMTSVTCRSETISNIITEVLNPSKMQAFDEAFLPITNDNIVAISREKTYSNTIKRNFVAKPKYIASVSSTGLCSYGMVSDSATGLVLVTLYTTLSYFTTTYHFDNNLIHSRYEIMIKVMKPTKALSLASNVGIVENLNNSSYCTKTYSLTPHNFLLYDYKKVVDAGRITTFYLTSGIFFTTDEDGSQSELQSTSASLYGFLSRQYKTGLVSLIEETRVSNNTTTSYQSEVIGIFMGNHYAQIIETISKVLDAISIDVMKATQTLLIATTQLTIPHSSEYIVHESNFEHKSINFHAKNVNRSKYDADENDHNKRARTMTRSRIFGQPNKQPQKANYGVNEKPPLVTLSSGGIIRMRGSSLLYRSLIPPSPCSRFLAGDSIIYTENPYAHIISCVVGISDHLFHTSESLIKSVVDEVGPSAIERDNEDSFNALEQVQKNLIRFRGSMSRKARLVTVNQQTNVVHRNLQNFGDIQLTDSSATPSEKQLSQTHQMRGYMRPKVAHLTSLVGVLKKHSYQDHMEKKVQKHNNNNGSTSDHHNNSDFFDEYTKYYRQRSRRSSNGKNKYNYKALAKVNQSDVVSRVRRKTGTPLNTRSSFPKRFRTHKLSITPEERNYTEMVRPEIFLQRIPASRSLKNERFVSRYMGHHLSKTTVFTMESLINTIRPPRRTRVRAKFTLRDTFSTQKVSMRPKASHFRRLQNTVTSRRSSARISKSRQLKSFNINSMSHELSSRSISSRTRSNLSRTHTTVRGRNRNENNGEKVSHPYDGTIIVTHVVPDEVTITVVNGKVTEYRNVVTSKTSTEIISPQQYTNVVDSSGQTILVLIREDSSVKYSGATEVTQYVLHESPTTTVMFTPTTIRGRKTSFSHVIQSTAYSVENVISTSKPEISANIPLANLLLSQILLGNIGLHAANPLLGEIGSADILFTSQITVNTLGEQVPVSPVTEYRTYVSTYLKTIFGGMSTVIPVTFQGRKIMTTVYETSLQTITATEFITDTIITTPTQQLSPQSTQINSILLQKLLLESNPESQIKQPLLKLHELDTKNIGISNENANDIPLIEENQKHILSAKKATKSEKTQKRKYILTPGQAPESSRIITLYVSGKRPGEFSTILSTLISNHASRIQKVKL